jgi:hypothetical protein
MKVVGRGSGDQNGQGTQDQQIRNSRIKNIFLELKLSVTPKWDSADFNGTGRMIGECKNALAFFHSKPK